MSDVACDEVKDPNAPKENYELEREAQESIRKLKEDAYRDKVKGYLMNIEYFKREIKRYNEKIAINEKQLEEMKTVNINDMEIYVGEKAYCLGDMGSKMAGEVAKRCC